MTRPNRSIIDEPPGNIGGVCLLIVGAIAFWLVVLAIYFLK